MPGPPPAQWPAAWICHPAARQEAEGVYHFRRRLELPDLPDAFRVRVSADNRYELFVNGTRVSASPARGDVWHWRYDTVDLRPHLRQGPNVLAAVAWFLGEDHAPLSQMAHAPGFRRVRVAPHPGGLELAEETIPHPRGEGRVRLRGAGDKLSADVSLPPDTEGVFQWNGRERPLHTGEQNISCERQ